MLKRFNKAQSVLEYAILVTVVAIAFVAMQRYFHWAVNSQIDQIKEHFEVEEAE